MHVAEKRQQIWTMAEGYLSNVETLPPDGEPPYLFWAVAYGWDISNPYPLKRSAYPRCWCGAFALAVLRMCGVTDRVWRNGVGFIYTGAPLRTTKTPEIGDIGYRDLNQHYCIAGPTIDGVVHTIDGNSGVPSAVRRREVRLGTPGQHWFSVTPWLAEVPRG